MKSFYWSHLQSQQLADQLRRRLHQLMYQAPVVILEYQLHRQ